jgi:hypothetical protein
MMAGESRLTRQIIEIGTPNIRAPYVSICLLLCSKHELTVSSDINYFTSGCMAVVMAHLPPRIECFTATRFGSLLAYTNPLLPVLYNFIAGGCGARGWSLDTNGHHFHFQLRYFRIYVQESAADEKRKRLGGRLRGPFLTMTSNNGIAEKIYSIYIHTDAPNVDSPAWTCVAYQDKDFTRPPGMPGPPGQPLRVGLVQRPDQERENCAKASAPRNSMRIHFLSQVSAALRSSLGQWEIVLDTLDTEVDPRVSALPYP